MQENAPGSDPAKAFDFGGERLTAYRYSLLETLRLIRSDLAFRRAFELDEPGRRRTFGFHMRPAAACVIRYRLQCLLYSHGLTPLGWAFKFFNLLLYGVDIDHRARIGGGLVIPHPVAILITADVTIGERCVIHHQTAIGRSPYFEPGREPGPLMIGKDVTFGMGSCAYGNIVIGDGCRIGANTVVDRSVPSGSFLFGVPARIVATLPGRS